MSNLIVPNTAKKRVGQAILDAATWGTVKLFKNDATIGPATVLGDLTEANFTGYSSQALAGGTVLSPLDAQNRAVVQWNLLTWTKSGATGNDIYGYWVIDSTGALVFVEKFDSFQPMQLDGQIVQFQPKFTIKSQFLNT